jgi:DNA repair and recombination protein RAD52
MGYTRRRARSARRLRRGGRSANTNADSLPARAVAVLNQSLDAAVVSERETRDGQLVRYIEGWAAISQANRVFGFDTWGAEVVGDVAFRPFSFTDPDTGEQLAVGMYSTAVRVSVRGCLPRVDVGCAFAANDTPEAHEAAFKGAVTDALKRSLRYFGDQFGNRLYDRRSGMEAASSPPVSAPQIKGEEMRRRVLELSARLGADEVKARAWAQKRYGQELDVLTAEQLADAVRFLADKLNRRNGSTATRRDAESQAA